MLAYNSTTTQAFNRDQIVDWKIEYWDTPFLAMDGDAASGGIPMEVREPHPTYSWSAFRANFVADFNDAAKAVQRVVGGRTDQLVGYWAGGAPAHHGVTTNGRVAYRFRCYLRPIVGRGWFDGNTLPQFYLAVAGQGRMAINKVRAVTGGGATTTLLAPTDITELDFLENNFTLCPTIVDMGAGDYLDIYYIQDANVDSWGGFVVKVVPGARSSSRAADLALAAEAPVLGCGLFDDDRLRLGQLDPQPVLFAQSVEVKHGRGVASSCEFELPLINPNVHDGFGWEWYRPTSQSVGQLRMWTEGAATFSLKRKRIIRVTAGWQNEPYTIFTGLVHDFGDPVDGKVKVQCQSFESRLLDRYDKNLPDKISYMTFGYNQLIETPDPVYEIPAYDNWPLEYAILDLATRAGIDASLTRQPAPIPKLDGTESYI